MEFMWSKRCPKIPLFDVKVRLLSSSIDWFQVTYLISCTSATSIYTESKSPLFHLKVHFMEFLMEYSTLWTLISTLSTKR